MPEKWSDAMERFTTYLAAGERSRHTFQHYRSYLAQFAAWWTRDEFRPPLEPEAIKGADLRAWKHDLSNELIKTTGRERMPATVNAKLSAMRSFLMWAERSKIIKQAPDMPRPVRETRKIFKALHRNEQNRIARVIDRAGIRRDMGVFRILLNTGLRITEACKLRWRDVRIEGRKGEITVIWGKGQKRRSIPLNKEAREGFALLLPVDPDPDARVLRGQRGPIAPRGIQLMLGKYGRTAGVRITPHKLRHSFARNLLQAGIPIPTVAAIMGHESTNTTMGYLNPSDLDMEKAVNAIPSLGDEA
jgi:integrase